MIPSPVGSDAVRRPSILPPPRRPLFTPCATAAAIRHLPGKTLPRRQLCVVALSFRGELRLFDFGQVRENVQRSAGDRDPAHSRRAGPHRRVVPSACTVSTKTLWPLLCFGRNKAQSRPSPVTQASHGTITSISCTRAPRLANTTTWN